jgi:hypothetical protein
LRTHQKIQNKEKLDFYISNRSISRSGYVMKGKMELLTNFKWILKMLIPIVEMLQKEMPSLCNIFFFKTVKIEPRNKGSKFFLELDAFNARKTSLFISFTSLIGIE